MARPGTLGGKACSVGIYTNGLSGAAPVFEPRSSAWMPLWARPGPGRCARAGRHARVTARSGVAGRSPRPGPAAAGRSVDGRPSLGEMHSADAAAHPRHRGFGVAARAFGVIGLRFTFSELGGPSRSPQRGTCNTAVDKVKGQGQGGAYDACYARHTALDQTGAFLVLPALDCSHPSSAEIVS